MFSERGNVACSPSLAVIYNSFSHRVLSVLFVFDENCEDELESSVRKVGEFADYHEDVTFFIVGSTSKECESLKLLQARTKLPKVFLFNRFKDFSSMSLDMDNLGKVSTELDIAKRLFSINTDTVVLSSKFPKTHHISEEGIKRVKSAKEANWLIQCRLTPIVFLKNINTDSYYLFEQLSKDYYQFQFIELNCTKSKSLVQTKLIVHYFDESVTKKEFSFDNEKDREKAVHFVRHLKELMLRKIETLTHSLQNIGTISSLLEVENLLQNFEVVVVLVYSAENDNNFYQTFTEIKRSFANALFVTLDVDGLSGDKKNVYAQTHYIKVFVENVRIIYCLDSEKDEFVEFLNVIMGNE